MVRIKKGDEIVILTGSDKGKQGPVTKLVYDSNRQITHVVVTGIKLCKRHTKPNPAKGETGGIINKEAPVHISNVALFNDATKKHEKVRIKVGKDGKRQREFASGGVIS